MTVQNAIMVNPATKGRLIAAFAVNKDGENISRFFNTGRETKERSRVKEPAISIRKFDETFKLLHFTAMTLAKAPIIDVYKHNPTPR